MATEPTARLLPTAIEAVTAAVQIWKHLIKILKKEKYIIQYRIAL
jgi:hypothetical protein